MAISNHRVMRAFRVADFFLWNVDHSAGDSITNLKMQKLCYFAQARCLAHHGYPLFSERIEAWAHGPVVPALYFRFRKYKWMGIDPTDAKPIRGLSEVQSEVLAGVWEKFSPKSARELENLTHSHAPWKDVYGDRKWGRACTDAITHEAIKNFYEKRLDAC